MKLYFYLKRSDNANFYRIPLPQYCDIKVVPRIGEKVIYENRLFLVNDIVHEIETYSVSIKCYLSPVNQEDTSSPKSINLTETFS